ncbi:MAG: hypothetical protein HYW23_01720 [Candidatus Aenigmarchaeota archaeon]|nr:hypothetical protein [Candidatus Aenigmarchaeota archaeon]
MSTVTQVSTCTEQYKMWKDKALFSNDVYAARKALERAFFWMELRSAFIFLHTVEMAKGDDKETKRKLLQAKLNLSRKLTEHLKDTLKGI